MITQSLDDALARSAAASNRHGSALDLIFGNDSFGQMAWTARSVSFVFSLM